MRLIDDIRNGDSQIEDVDIYDALFWILANEYPDLSDEELEDLLDEYIAQLSDSQTEAILDTIGLIAKKIGTGAARFAKDNPKLVQGAAALAGGLIAGPAGAAVAGSVVKGLQKNSANDTQTQAAIPPPSTPETNQPIANLTALLQDAQFQTALVRGTVGMGTAPYLATNGTGSQVPLSVYLRSLMTLTEKALVELEQKHPAQKQSESYIESLGLQENSADDLGEWLAEDILEINAQQECLDDIDSEEEMIFREDIKIGNSEVTPKHAKKLLSPFAKAWFKDISDFLKTDNIGTYEGNVLFFKDENEVYKKSLEIYEQMSESYHFQVQLKGNPPYKKYPFNYSDDTNFLVEIKLRLALLQFMYLANTLKFARYPEFEEEGFKMPHNGKAYKWEDYKSEGEDNNRNKASKTYGFRIKQGESASLALKEILKSRDDNRIVVDCSTMLGIVYYISILYSIGDEEFDKKFNNNLIIGALGNRFPFVKGMAYKGDPHTLVKYSYDSKHEIKDYTFFRPCHINKYEHLVIGDRITFANVKTYKGHLWAGLYGVYEGKSGPKFMFSGFGVQSKSHKEINRALEEENENKIDPKVVKVGKLVTFSGDKPGLLTDIYRFNIESLLVDITDIDRLVYL